LPLLTKLKKTTSENQEKIRSTLMKLPDQAAKDVYPDDLDSWNSFCGSIELRQLIIQDHVWHTPCTIGIYLKVLKRRSRVS
jgi:hypothetical protein